VVSGPCPSDDHPGTPRLIRRLFYPMHPGGQVAGSADARARSAIGRPPTSDLYDDGTVVSQYCLGRSHAVSAPSSIQNTRAANRASSAPAEFRGI